MNFDREDDYHLESAPISPTPLQGLIKLIQSPQDWSLIDNLSKIDLFISTHGPPAFLQPSGDNNLLLAQAFNTLSLPLIKIILKHFPPSEQRQLDPSPSQHSLNLNLSIKNNHNSTLVHPLAMLFLHLPQSPTIAGADYFDGDAYHSHPNQEQLDMRFNSISSWLFPTSKKTTPTTTETASIARTDHDLDQSLFPNHSVPKWFISLQSQTGVEFHQAIDIITIQAIYTIFHFLCYHYPRSIDPNLLLPDLFPTLTALMYNSLPIYPIFIKSLLADLFNTLFPTTININSLIPHIFRLRSPHHTLELIIEHNFYKFQLDPDLVMYELMMDLRQPFVSKFILFFSGAGGNDEDTPHHSISTSASTTEIILSPTNPKALQQITFFQPVLFNDGSIQLEEYFSRLISNTQFPSLTGFPTHKQLISDIQNLDETSPTLTTASITTSAFWVLLREKIISFLNTQTGKFMAGSKVGDIGDIGDVVDVADDGDDDMNLPPKRNNGPLKVTNNHEYLNPIKAVFTHCPSIALLLIKQSMFIRWPHLRSQLNIKTPSQQPRSPTSSSSSPQQQSPQSPQQQSPQQQSQQQLDLDFVSQPTSAVSLTIRGLGNDFSLANFLFSHAELLRLDLDLQVLIDCVERCQDSLFGLGIKHFVPHFEECMAKGANTNTTTTTTTTATSTQPHTERSDKLEILARLLRAIQSHRGTLTTPISKEVTDTLKILTTATSPKDYYKSVELCQLYHLPQKIWLSGIPVPPPTTFASQNTNESDDGMGDDRNTTTMSPATTITPTISTRAPFVSRLASTRRTTPITIRNSDGELSLSRPHRDKTQAKLTNYIKAYHVDQIRSRMTEELINVMLEDF